MVFVVRGQGLYLAGFRDVFLVFDFFVFLAPLLQDLTFSRASYHRKTRTPKPKS